MNIIDLVYARIIIHYQKKISMLNMQSMEARGQEKRKRIEREIRKLQGQLSETVSDDVYSRVIYTKAYQKAYQEIEKMTISPKKRVKRQEITKKL